MSATALVDEVRAEIHQQAVGGAGGFLPGVLALDGAVNGRSATRSDEAAERAVGEYLLDGQEVTVPARVVETARRALRLAVASATSSSASALEPAKGLSMTTCLPAESACLASA